MVMPNPDYYSSSAINTRLKNKKNKKKNWKQN